MLLQYDEDSTLEASWIGFLGAVVAAGAVLVGVFIERQTGVRLAAEQRCKDQNQRWRERRQDLIRQLQDHAFSLSQKSGAATGIRNRPELNEGRIVSFDTPWFQAMLEDEKAAFNLTALLGDTELQSRVYAFVAHVQGARQTIVSSQEELSDLIRSFEQPLSDVIGYAGQLYRNLEGPEPQCGVRSDQPQRQRWQCWRVSNQTATSVERWLCARPTPR
jgi:hypothetical protein